MAAILFAWPVCAESIAPAPAVTAMQRLRGKIVSYDAFDRSLSLDTADKHSVTVALEPDLRIIYNTHLSLADVKAGDFIGTTTLKAADGTLRAQEVHVFPDVLRGIDEGQSVPDPASANRSMINATVAGVDAQAGNRGAIKLTYRGAGPAPDGTCAGRAAQAVGAGCAGQAEVQVVPGIPIIGIMVGDESMLVPGAAVSLSVVAGPNGALEASSLSIDRSGAAPAH